jgi:pyrroloquinoline-quinone synthase
VTETFWDRIEAARSSRNVLEHPFYTRWSAGELTAEELARYSGQYRHAVAAIADASQFVAEQLPGESGLAGHAREEAEHVAVWDRFVDRVGGDSDAAPAPETAECAAEWSREDDPVSALARLYAIESGQPAISQTKLEGLVEHYGIASGPGTDYFTLHCGRDVEHAAEGRELLERLLTPEAEERALAAAEAAFRANWRLLDGIEAARV